jgi:DegV family protein with EDD domain
MSNVCILTDNTVQFSVPAFPGRDLVHIISIDLEWEGKLYVGGEGLKANMFPTSITKTDHNKLKIIPPSVDDFKDLYFRLSNHYDEIVVILQTSSLSNLVENAKAATDIVQGKTDIFITDSGTTGTGLGFVVELAAKLASEGHNGEYIDQQLRDITPRLYTIFCIEGLSYLHKQGFLEEAQATVGEYLKIRPLYIFDNGKFMASQKARNYRHLVDIFHEFITEFLEIDQIAFIQGVPAFENETRTLRERLVLDYEGLLISEHTINPSLAAMIGPRSLGLFVLQKE